MEEEQYSSDSDSESGERTFSAPSYYKNFSCKCGDCRTPCCGGWGVTVSMKEYFDLLSLDCSEELRHKINCALCIKNAGNESEYANLTPSWLGTCHLQREDGLCMIHAECGEDKLPCVCRLYPRCAREGEVLRLCCSASCEKVVELFMDMKDSMTFEDVRFASNAPMRDDMTADEFEKQKQYIKILQNRSISIESRLLDLHRHMFSADIRGSEAEILSALKIILDYYESHSESIEMLCEKYESIRARGKLREAMDTLDQKYPDFEILAEHLLVNHVFYSAFPRGDKRIDNEGAFFALCAVYSLTKLFSAVSLYEADENADVKVILSDAISAFFRLCEHSSFDYNCIVLLKRAGMLTKNI